MALHLPNHCSYCFCHTFMCRHPPPIGSNRSPYSLCVQVERSSENQPFEQVIADEWSMPKLWPGSCTVTTQPIEALYQVSFEGLLGVPPLARPDQLHALCFGTMTQLNWVQPSAAGIIGVRAFESPRVSQVVIA